MKTVSPDVPSPRVLLFGLQCAFTNLVAAGLSERGLPPSAIVVKGHPKLERPLRTRIPRTTLPIAGTQQTTIANEYPTFQIGHLTSQPTIELIESFQPDVIAVACFSGLIPRVVREIPRWLSFNIHPSLLPAHRGPDPLFWIMRDGGAGFGVTIHELSGTFDEGDILAQRAIMYPDGARERDLEVLLANAGADLAAEVVTTRTNSGLRRRAQDERAATYESWPDHDDYEMSVDRPVRDAWNFVRGVAGRSVPVWIVTESGRFLVSDAIDFRTTDAPLAATDQDEVVVRFTDGWLLARTYRPKKG